jgi:hypothetical protein
MSISSVNPAAPYALNMQDASSQGGSVRSAFASLTRSLQSGDVASAQQAFASIEQAFGASGSPTEPAASASPASGAAGTMNADLQAVGKALQSGDVQGAQSALDKLRQDMRGAMGGHHHHGHHGGGAATVTPPATTGGSTTPSASTPAVGSSIDVTA